MDQVNGLLEPLGNGVAAQRLHVETIGLSREDHEGDHSNIRARGLQHVVQPCQRLDEDIRALVGELVPSRCEQVQGTIKVEVKVAVEVPSNKLVDLLLAGGVQVLELMQISFHVKAIRSDQVRLPPHQVGGLHAGDLRHGGEDVRQVGPCPLDAVPVEDPSLARLLVAVEVLQVVVEVSVAGAEVSSKLGGVGREDGCYVCLPQPGGRIRS